MLHLCAASQGANFCPYDNIIFERLNVKKSELEQNILYDKNFKNELWLVDFTMLQSYWKCLDHMETVEPLCY